MQGCLRENSLEIFKLIVFILAMIIVRETIELKPIESYFDGEMYQEMFEAMRYFLISFEIREGKFEGNEILLNKLNRNDVIIYKEYQMQDGSFNYTENAHIYRIKDIVDILDKLAEEKGLHLQRD